MNVFYVSIRTTQNYEFDKIRTAGVTGNATNYKNSQGDISIICSTRDEISQPSRAFSPRAATGNKARVTLQLDESVGVSNCTYLMVYCRYIHAVEKMSS